MITFSNLGKQGRFGNQLFQIASIIGLGNRYKVPVAFPQWEYADYFVNQLPHGEQDYYFEIEETKYHPDWIQWDEYYDLFQQYNVNINGYLQSSKYFEGVNVHKLFELKPEFIAWQKAKFAHVFEKQVIAISIRRGDYVNNPNYHLLPIRYYIGALLQNFPDFKQYNVLVFSDDYDYCRFHFGCLSNVYYAEGNEIEDHALLRECDHFILANSTFAFWGAYLGRKPHSKVIRPNFLFAGRLYAENGDTHFFENDWEVFDHTAYKIDLDDTTFLIPVYNDSSDRDENVNLCVKQLKEDFNCKILIGENKTKSFTHLKGHNWFNFPDFHRTRILNILAFKATTSIVANWDGDVFVAPMQILETVEAIRKGVDMVYPYDGSFARFPRTPHHDELNKSRDIGILAGKTFFGMNLPVSVGGAVFFNKESFFKGGMENENFVSYGPEDRERYERFDKLGFTIKRIPGTLYHLEHKINKDSSNTHEHYVANVEELSRIETAHPDTLREEIESWSWLARLA